MLQILETYNRDKVKLKQNVFLYMAACYIHHSASVRIENGNTKFDHWNHKIFSGDD